MTKGMEKLIDKYYDQDEHDKIVELILSVPEGDRDVEMLGQLVVAYNNLGRFEDAIELSMEIKEKSKDLIRWYYRVSYAYMGKDDFKEALKNIQVAMELSDKKNDVEWKETCQEIYDECQECLKTIDLYNDSSFDYEKLKLELINELKGTASNLLGEYEDIYIISLDCAREVDSVGLIANTVSYLEERSEEDEADKFYYKYCEEEWELSETFEGLSNALERFVEDNADRFTNEDDFTYTPQFNEHCEKVFEACQEALLQFRKYLDENKLDIMLAFNVREYLDEEERVAVFKKLNSAENLEEYEKHIEEFC